MIFALVIFFINDGKLTENRRKIPSRLKCVEFIHQGDRKTVGKFRRIRNFPSSSSEIVGFTRFSCRKSFPSPLQVSLLHPFRLAEFSVNFFFSDSFCFRLLHLGPFSYICLLPLILVCYATGFNEIHEYCMQKQ